MTSSFLAQPGSPVSLGDLRGSQIEPAPGQARHVARRGRRIENQFHPAPGLLVVDTIEPDRLLVPTTKSLTGPVAAPDPGGHDVDHFKCDTVKGSPDGPEFTPVRG
jgi:hypothetical protein